MATRVGHYFHETHVSCYIRLLLVMLLVYSFAIDIQI